jgi:hypothetical protein
VTPYSQGRHYDTPKKSKELHSDYEKRTWRDRLHVNDDGKVFIPSMAFKVCIAEAAKYLSEQIPGKGKSTYTKHFEAGISVPEPLVLPISKEDPAPEWVFVPADGRRGSGKRVDKCFPRINQWEGHVTFLVLDDVITEDVFKRTLTTAGLLIGIGRFRPRNNGDYGRFAVAGIEWQDS